MCFLFFFSGLRFVWAITAFEACLGECWAEWEEALPPEAE
jgi:hypothetical protein